MAEEITASVGKTGNGTRECYNIVKDQLAVIRLLNAIKQSEGGRLESPLPTNPEASLTKDVARIFRTAGNGNGRIGSMHIEV